LQRNWIDWGLEFKMADLKTPDMFDMDSALSAEERQVRDAVARFVDERVLPMIADCFESERFPAELVPEMAEMGLFGSTLEERYGGAGLSHVAYGLIMQELERGDSGIRSFASVQSSLVMFPIHRYGSDEQKERWLPALARAEAADLKVMVLDAADGAPGPDIAALIDQDTLVALNKIDLVDREAIPDMVGGVVATAVSVKTGENLEALLGAIGDRVAAGFAPGGGPPLTRLRHRAALGDCRAALDRALAGTAIELIAEDVRLAARALGRITGRVDVEDLLDVIFRDFCIGK